MDPADGEATPTEARQISRLRALGGTATRKAHAWSTVARERIPGFETGWRIYERDKQAVGTLLGSALALRLFLFFVPFLLVLVGIAGLLGRYLSIDGLSEQVGMSGTIAGEIDSALDQQTVTPWLAIAIGLFGIATTGRSLSRALVLSSALSWHLGGKQRVSVRAIGITVGILSGFGLAWAIVNRIRAEAGVAVVTISLVGVVLVYLALWSLLYLALPRATTDPAAALPGAAIVALVLSGLQWITVLYLPDKISGASTIYGAAGAIVVLLGWFFIIGRVVAFSFAVNAIIFETYGSISHLLFSLPVLRRLPRRFPAVARFFDLRIEEPDEAPSPGA